MKGRPLSGPRAAWIVARLSVKRLLRGWILWLTIGLVSLPAAAAMIIADHMTSGTGWRHTYDLLIGLLALLPPLYLASAVGEETEDKTYTYLWSRPFPRESILAGKLMGLIPIAIGLACAGVVLAFVAVFGTSAPDNEPILSRGLVAMTLGTITASAFCAAIATLIPRHATAITLIYLMVVDTSVALMPFSIHNLTVRYHTHELALTGVAPGHVVWLLAMTAVWLAVAMIRVRSAEYSGES